jgi:hypothetical protein
MNFQIAYLKNHRDPIVEVSIELREDLKRYFVIWFIIEGILWHGAGAVEHSRMDVPMAPLKF